MCNWPCSCNWQALPAISRVLFWAFATTISRSPYFQTFKEENSLEDWLKSHSKIPRDTLKRRKCLYFSLWLFCHTRLTDLIINNDARNKFGIPNMLDKPYWLLCLLLNLLILIFSNQAFAAPKLTSPEQLFRQDKNSYWCLLMKKWNKFNYFADLKIP